MIKVIHDTFDQIIGAIPEEARVLDVGGAAAPTRRADHIIDIVPYGQVRFGAAKGPGEIKLLEHQYAQFDICSRQPWPYPDKFFDYSICSHTLEDVRDPLWVCSELLRISKAGYIETPSRLYETSFGIEAKKLAGNCHHHWIVEEAAGRLSFTFKYSFVHIPFINQNRKKYANRPESVLQVEWQDGFEYFENWLADGRAIFEYYLGRRISDKEMWKIFRKLQDRNFVAAWLAYIKNTNKFANRVFKKFFQ